MTFTTMTKNIARMIVMDTAFFTEHRMIRCEDDLTECDLENVETYTSMLRNLFMHSDGCTWSNVLNKIKSIAGFDLRIGFKEQDKIISVCEKYGIRFVKATM